MPAVKARPSLADRLHARIKNRTAVVGSCISRERILGICGQLATLSVSELARPFPLKLPAIMKHLDVLSDAGLVSRRKRGRTVSVLLTPGPMEEAMAWLRRYERFWSGSLDRLATLVEEDVT